LRGDKSDQGDDSQDEQQCADGSDDQTDPSPTADEPEDERQDYGKQQVPDPIPAATSTI